MPSVNTPNNGGGGVPKVGKVPYMNAYCSYLWYGHKGASLPTMNIPIPYDLSHAFENTINVTRIDITSGPVTNMSYMCKNSGIEEALNLSYDNINDATYAYAETKIRSFGNLTTSLPGGYNTNLSYLFYSCKELVSLGDFMFRKSTDCTSMCENCTALTTCGSFTNSLNPSYLDKRYYDIYLNFMFKNCVKLTWFDVVSISLGPKTSASGTFEGCTALRSVALPMDINTEKNRTFVINYSAATAMFKNCYNLQLGGPFDGDTVRFVFKNLNTVNYDSMFMNTRILDQYNIHSTLSFTGKPWNLKHWYEQDDTYPLGPTQTTLNGILEVDLGRMDYMNLALNTSIKHQSGEMVYYGGGSLAFEPVAFGVSAADSISITFNLSKTLWDNGDHSAPMVLHVLTGHIYPRINFINYDTTVDMIVYYISDINEISKWCKGPIYFEKVTFSDRYRVSLDSECPASPVTYICKDCAGVDILQRWCADCVQFPHVVQIQT